MRRPPLHEVVETVHDFRIQHPRLNRLAETRIGKGARRAGFGLVEKGYERLQPKGRLAEWRTFEELSLEAITRGAIQKPEEFAALLRMAGKRRPRTVLEIGTAGGGTIFGFAHVAAEDALLISVDLADDAFPESYDGRTARRIRTYAGPDQELHLLQGDSHDPATALAVTELLDGRSVDLLFIDGDHSLEGVTRDWADYSPLVGEGGQVALHDIVDHRRNDVGVHLLWEEISPEYPHHELIDPDEPEDPHPWAGIGVIEIGTTADSGGDVHDMTEAVRVDGNHVDLPRA